MRRTIRNFWLNTPADEVAGVLLVGLGFGLVLLVGLQTLEEYPIQSTGTLPMERIR